jgi:hypothetical protein
MSKTYSVLILVLGEICMNGQTMCRKCQRRIKVHNAMRNLWEHHIFWTYNFINSMVQNLPDAKYARQRLLQNPEDFERELVPYYSRYVSNLFATLLREHLVLAADMLSAILSGNPREADRLKRQWYQNAEDIARFLSEINQYWRRDEWKNMLFEHLKMVERMVELTLSENQKEKVFFLDEMEKQALSMADYMTQGILSQF